MKLPECYVHYETSQDVSFDKNENIKKLLLGTIHPAGEEYHFLPTARCFMNENIIKSIHAKLIELNFREKP